MNPSELATKMLEWEQKKRELDTLEAEIVETVLALEKTQVVGNVRASYRQGTRSFNHEQPVEEALAKAIEEKDGEQIVKINTAINAATTVVVNTNWIVVRESLGLEPTLVSQGKPSVTLKLES